MECAFDLDDPGLGFAGETAAEAYEATGRRVGLFIPLTDSIPSKA